MKNNLYLICFILMVSCQQQPPETGCNEIIEASFKGAAAIFFHRPTSGSTYQLFLIPLCNAGPDSKLKGASRWASLGKGISFDLTSDDPRFRTLYNNAQKESLQGRDQMGENYRSIYYCFAKVETSYDPDGIKEVEESKKLIFGPDSVLLKYRFISYVKFTILDSLPIVK